MEEGRILSHYRILSRIGEGGMGQVYRAEDTRLGRVVALKLLPEEFALDEERLRRFEREARIVSALSHPGIATLYDFDRVGEVAYLAMEYVDGPNLRQLLREGPLSLDRVLDCGTQVAEAVAAAHREGVVHRDLKPENVMVAGSGYYKVLDFGVARRESAESRDAGAGTELETRTSATREGVLIGTLSYMSPEQVLGSSVDARSDVFAIGTLLYELITGRPAFQRGNPIATAHAIAYEEPEPVAAPGSEATAVAPILERCLAKDPDDRYPSAQELASDLRALRQETLSGSGTRTDFGLPFPRPPGRKRTMVWAGVAVAGAIALAVAGSFLFQRGFRDRTPPSVAVPAGPVSRAGDVLPATRSGVPRIVVAFFENNTGDAETEWLGRGLPEMLTTDLSRSGEFEVIATQKLYDLLALSGDGADTRLDRATTTELARWAGADIVISGSLFRLGDTYRIDAQAYDTASGTVRVAGKVEGTDVFRMVNELTAELRDGLGVARGPTVTEPVPTTSPEAFRSYAQGKMLYDRLEFREAANRFRDALEMDPGFELARLRLGTSLLAAGEASEAEEVLRVVSIEGDALPPEDRKLAEGLRAFFIEGDQERGNRTLETMVREHPESREALVWWARGIRQLDGSPLQSMRRLRRAMDLDPGYLPAVADLVNRLADLGDVEGARAILEDSIRRNPDSRDVLQPMLEELAAAERAAPAEPTATGRDSTRTRSRRAPRD